MILEAEVGMLIVETIAKIRRAFFVQGKSIKAICRELRVSRKVVRKVIRSEATEFRNGFDHAAGDKSDEGGHSCPALRWLRGGRVVSARPSARRCRDRAPFPGRRCARA